MQAKTVIPQSFSDIVSCDYVLKNGCLFLLSRNEAEAYLLMDDCKRLKRWLGNKAPGVDGVFIDYLDGSRIAAFRVGDRPPLSRRLPFSVTDSMALFDVICLGRVSRCITWVYSLDADGNEVELLYSNQDRDGSITGQWNAEPVYRPEAVQGLAASVADWTWRGQDYRVIQYSP